MANRKFLDQTGLATVFEIVDNKITNSIEAIDFTPYLTEHQSLAEYAKTSDVESTYATKTAVASEIQAKINELVNNAPENLDTLKEIAAWVNDPNNEDTTSLIRRVMALESENTENEESIQGLTTRLNTVEAIDHSQYLTEHQDITMKADKDELPTPLTRDEILAVWNELQNV